MADVLTQLQDYINELYDTMCNAVGLLQAEKHDCGVDEKSTKTETDSKEDLVALFARQFRLVYTDIGKIIDSLPNAHCTREIQELSMGDLEQGNNMSVHVLRSSIEISQNLLDQVLVALKEITQLKLGTDRLYADLLAELEAASRQSGVAPPI